MYVCGCAGSIHLSSTQNSRCSERFLCFECIRAMSVVICLSSHWQTHMLKNSRLPRKQQHEASVIMACLKLPSIPETSMALVIMRVSRKGTFSGNFSRFMLACKVPAKFVQDFRCRRKISTTDTPYTCLEKEELSCKASSLRMMHITTVNMHCQGKLLP